MSQLVKRKSSTTSRTQRSATPTVTFIERVNEVLITQILTQTRNKGTDRSYKELLSSPATARRIEIAPRSRRAKKSGDRCEKPMKGLKLVVELGCYKIKEVMRTRLRNGFTVIGSFKTGLEESTLAAQVSELLTSLRKSPSLTQTVAMTRCASCAQRSLTLLTSSTQDELSPRFFEKVKSFLPKVPQDCKQGFCLNKVESNLNLPDISNIEPYALSDKQDSFEESQRAKNTMKLDGDEVSFEMISESTHFKTPFFEKENLQYSHETTIKVPKLHFGDFIAVKQAFSRPKTPDNKQPSVKTSPQLGKKNGSCMKGLEAVSNLIESRLRRVFDIIFLSRSHNQFETSLTFDFSKDDLADTLSQFPARYQNLRNPLSPIKFVENSSLKNSKKPAIISLKMSAKILVKRLEKLVYSRELQGFYSLTENMMLI